MGNANYAKTLFLNPPSFEGFDGGAGSRYQAKREIRSFWYPTWLAQPAAMVPGQQTDRRAGPRAVPRGHRAARARLRARGSAHQHAVVSLRRLASRRRSRAPTRSSRSAWSARTWRSRPRTRCAPPRRSTSWAATSSTTRSRRSPRAAPGDQIDGLSFRVNGNGHVVHNKERATLEDMDRLPFVTDVYRRDLVIEDYFIGYLLHPYVSLYTGRGCRSKCTLLPLAADDRRPPLPHAQRRERRRGDPAGQGVLPAGQGVLLRRRHLHGRSAPRGGDRGEAGRDRRDLVVQRQGESSRTSRSRS